MHSTFEEVLVGACIPHEHSVAIQDRHGRFEDQFPEDDGIEGCVIQD